MNQMQAISNEIQSIIHSLQSENPITMLPRISKIYMHSHLYLNQWKSLEINIDVLKNIISIVRRYEANALQLHGKGLWLLSMILQYTCNKIEFNDFIHKMLYDTLIRIAVEHPVHFVCTSILTFHLDNCNRTIAIKIFETDTLPEVIPANNFISLLHFSISCISKDKSCALVACKFLVALVSHILEDYKANYFLNKVIKSLINLLPDSSNSSSKSLPPHLGSSNNSNETTTTKEDEEEQLIEYILILLKYICSLHPHHPMLIATIENDNKIHLSKVVIDILLHNHHNNQQQHSYGVECAALLFIDTLCVDSQVKAEFIKPYISIDQLCLKINARKPDVTEKASKLFLTLYANELDLNFKHTTEHSTSSSSSSAAAYNGSYTMRSRYTNCISCLQLILDTILEITKNNLQANSNSISSNALISTTATTTSTQSMHKKLCSLGSRGGLGLDQEEDDTIADEDEYSSSMSCFDCLNNVLYQIGLSINIHKIESLHITISNIITLIIDQFIKNPLSTLCINDANMIDSLFILIGIRERSWIASNYMNSIDINFNKQSIVLIDHFNDIASLQGLMDQSSRNTTRLSTAIRKTNGFSDDEYESDDDDDDDNKIDTSDEDDQVEDLSEAVKHSILLNTKNIEYINEKLKHHQLFHDFINDFLNQWEVENITLTSRKILVMYLLLMFQDSSMESFKSLSSKKDTYQEVIWDLLSDERFGLEEYPLIRKKCMQIFIALMSTRVVGESLPLTNGSILGGHLIKVLSSNHSKSRLLLMQQQSNKKSYHTLSNMMYNSQINELQYRYTALSCLIHVCETERTVRRKVISSYVEISNYFIRLDPNHSMTSLLQLLSICSEYLNKAEFEEEEAIVYLIIRALNYSDSCDYLMKIQVCEFITKIRLISPGIIHRCISRKEIEDGLIKLLQTIINKQRSNKRTSAISSKINDDMLRSVLKTCHALICNANMKPMWIPSPYSYHWSEYNWNIRNRPLYGIYFLNCLSSIIKHAHRKYRLQYFCISISILTALMYNCNDGVFVVNNNKLHLHHVTQLKEELISKYLPWLIVALDYLSTHRKVLQTGFQHIKNNNKTINTTKTTNTTTSIDKKQENLSFDGPEELLAENLIDALYAYLCMDEMFPLSTYLKHVILFSRTPLIACICYFMVACKDNHQILKKGVDIISHFAHNQIGLSAIGLHAPNSLLITATTLHDIMDIQISFCKIVIIVARSDDSSRENLIRFNIQKQLCKLIIKQHSEQSRMACLAMTELCVKNIDVDIICQKLPLIDCVIALLDSLPNDIKIQIEGLRLLITLDQMTDFLGTSKKISFFQVLKRTKLFLSQSLKQNQIPSEYDSNDIDNLLNSSIWNKDKCSIS